MSMRRFASRLLSGEDVVLVKQSVAHWDAPFADGKWERLREHQPNTAFLAGLILDLARGAEKPLRVLDIGCGNGGLARLISYAPGVEYQGLDVSVTAIEQARQDVPGAAFVVADAEHPPQGLEIFDVLVFNEILFYIDAATTLPRYALHAHADTVFIGSMIRSWRSPFVWRRVARHLRSERAFVLREKGRHTFDVVVGRLLRSS
jgi:SAM-dependent methyltransferase